MINITYEAKRNLIAGHSVDTDYLITLDLSRQDISFRPEGRRNVSIDGTTVNIINRLDEIWDLTSVILSDTSEGVEANNLVMREFLYSVAAGELFEVGEVGSTDSETFILNNLRRPFRTRRVGTTELYTYSFQIRKIG